MSSTISAIQAGQLRYCMVLVIGGYHKLITDHPDPTELFTAGYGWDSTPWDSGTPANDAIGGLRLEGQHRSRIEPWKGRIDVERINVFIKNESFDNDDLAAFHAKFAGNETVVTADLPTDETTMTVADNSRFAGAGTKLYLGAETMTVASHTSGTETEIDERGVYEPFAADGLTNKFARDHALPVLDVDVDVPLLVTDELRHWAGRSAALYFHVLRTDDKVSSKANARLVWSGRVVTNPADTVDGETMFVLEDARGWIRDCVIGRDQFRGYLADGIYLAEGDEFDCRQIDASTPYDASTLDVIEEGGSPADHTEIAAGWWTLEELVSAFNEWLAGEVVATNLAGYTVTCELATGSTDGSRIKFIWDNAGGANQKTLAVRMKFRYWRYLGWEEASLLDSYRWRIEYAWGDVELVSDGVPLRILAGGIAGTANHFQLRIRSTGTWFDNSSWALEAAKSFFGGLLGWTNWGYVLIGGRLAAVKYTDDETLEDAQYVQMFGADAGIVSISVAYDAEGDIEVKQVPMLVGAFNYLLPRILASTGAAGYNHATYDVLPAQLAAGLPWDLLDDAFLASLDGLPRADAEVIIALAKPTKLEAILAPELVTRKAHVLISAGGIVFRSLQTPTAGLAGLTSLDETTKGICDRSGAQNPDRISVSNSEDYCFNTIKIRYNWDPVSEQFADNGGIEVKEPTSVEMIGSKPITIEARNTYAGLNSSIDAVLEMVADLASYVLPAFSVPLQIAKRSLSIPLWEDLVAGDLCSLDDVHLRDPTTGQRQVADQPCCILEAAHDWGSASRDPWGHVILMLPRWPSVAVYSPSMEVDETYTSGAYTNGVDVTNYRFAVKVHAHSLSTEDNDSTHFAVGDEVLACEIDPDSAAAPENLTTTIAEIGSIDATHDYVEVDDDPTGVFTAGVPIRIVSQNYAAAVATQQADCYMADDVDYRIENERGPYTYGDSQPTEGAAADPTELPEREASIQAADGKPLSSALIQALIRFNNNFPSYKSARSSGWICYDGTNSYWEGPAQTPWRWLSTKDYHVGPHNVGAGGLSRNLVLAVMLASSNAGDEVYCRITLSRNPPGGATRDSITFTGPYAQITFSTTSATPTIQTAQEIDPVCISSLGLGYMTIEVKGDGARVGKARVYAVSEDREGPLE